jgi:hypothetical protein
MGPRNQLEGKVSRMAQKNTKVQEGTHGFPE